MISAWRSVLLERAYEWGVPRTGRWDFLLHNNYHPHYSNLNVLWFHNGSQFPHLVTKVYFEPELPRREFDNLTRAHRASPCLVPRPLQLCCGERFWALWMAGVPGLPVLASTHHVGDILESMVDMVGLLHRSFRQPIRGMDSYRYRSMITAPLEALAGFGNSMVISEGCERLASMIDPEWLQMHPAIPQHGDLFCSNILWHRGAWHIIDWESFGMIDLPFYDLLTLLVSVLQVDGETPNHWKESVVKQIPTLIRRYAGVLGLSTSSLPMLLPLTLINWFYLQWSDGRMRFANRMFSLIEHYFENAELWEAVIIAGK